MADDIVTRLRASDQSAIDCSDEAADLLDAIDALHQPETIMGVVWCSTEHEHWPCPTARLLHPKEARRG